MRSERAEGAEEALPVFVFPSALVFTVSDPASHKQLLTLYNPYDFPIQYQGSSSLPLSPLSSL